MTRVASLRPSSRGARPLGDVNRLPRPLTATLAGVPAVFIVALFVIPLVTLIGTVVTVSTIGDAIDTPGIGSVLWYSTWQAALSTIATIAVGLVPTWLLSRRRFAGRRVLLAVVTVPFLLPTVVVGAAFAALLPGSLQRTTTAVIIAHVYFNIAVVVRVVGPLWSRLPDDLFTAAATLGAGPWTVWRRVTLPLLRPSLAAAASVVFAFTFTSFGVVVVVGSTARPTLEMEIARQATQLGRVGVAAVLSILQLLAIAAVVWAATRARSISLTGASGRHAGVAHRRGPGQRHVTRLVAVTVAVAAAAPLVALALRSVRVGDRWSLVGWRALNGDAGARPGAALTVDVPASLLTSARFAALAAIVAVVVGAAATLAATRSRNPAWIESASALPLAMSSVTLGLAMLVTFDTGIVDWRDRWWLVALGHALIAVPLVIRATLPVLRTVPTDLRVAAATLGASPWRAWWQIDVRLLLRPLVAATGLAAAVSLGEFGATTVLSRTGEPSVPLAISALLARTGQVPRAAGFALATVLMVVVAIVVIATDPAGRASGDDTATGTTSW